MSISQLLSRHRVRWLGHAARKPETTIVNQLLQDLNALGPRLQMDLLRDWPKLALDRDLWRGVASRC